MQSWTNRLLEFAVTVAVALLLNWAWTLLRPLIPVLVVSAGLGLMLSLALRRLRQ